MLRRALPSVAAIALMLAAPAEAQTTSPAPASQRPVSTTTAPRWEIEGYGGLALGSFSAGGSNALPPPGNAILTASFLFPSHLTSSWFFGDGASMLNNASAQLDLTSAISPLDNALRSGGLSAQQPHGGLRLRRTLNSRYAAEFSFDIGRSPRNLSGELTDAIAAARDSFESTFSALLASGPFTGVAVNATDASSQGSGVAFSFTGGLNISFRQRRGFVPYATIGAGVITHPDQLPSAALEGNYRASVLNNVPIDETDRVTVRVGNPSSTSPLVVFGGGIRRDRGDRWGWRLDGRVFATSGTRVLLDATPLVVSGTPAGFIESLTNPNLQFSNSASTGRISTLGGPLSNFEAFHGSVNMSVAVTVGVFKRF